jgi:hypothetical protein
MDWLDFWSNVNVKGDVATDELDCSSSSMSESSGKVLGMVMLFSVLTLGEYNPGDWRFVDCKWEIEVSRMYK